MSTETMTKLNQSLNEINNTLQSMQKNQQQSNNKFKYIQLPVLYIITFAGLWFLLYIYLGYRTETFKMEHEISQNKNYEQRISELEQTMKCLEADNSGEPRVTVIESASLSKCSVSKPKSQQDKCK